MTVLHAGGKFDPKIVIKVRRVTRSWRFLRNALSSLLTAGVHRNGKSYLQEYAFGKPLAPIKEIEHLLIQERLSLLSPMLLFLLQTEYKYDILAVVCVSWHI